MNKRSLTILLLALSLTGLCRQGSAQMLPKDILTEADKARGNVAGVIWNIDIESVEGGKHLNRSMAIKAKGYNVLAEYTGPKSMKGRKILMIDRNMWFVKPGLKKPVPLSPRQRLMGQAANGDIASANYSGDYAASARPDDTINGELCYCLDLKAVDSKATYERIVYWISVKRLVGVKAEFYSASGKLMKKAEFTYGNFVTVNGEVHPFISEMVITDAIMEENVTTMRYRDVILKEIPASTFNLNLLMM
ncbi:MAG: outer membrane lipoprotein-sorting protein [Pseudomonadota bacterium]